MHDSCRLFDTKFHWMQPSTEYSRQCMEPSLFLIEILHGLVGSLPFKLQLRWSIFGKAMDFVIKEYHRGGRRPVGLGFSPRSQYHKLLNEMEKIIKRRNRRRNDIHYHYYVAVTGFDRVSVCQKYQINLAVLGLGLLLCLSSDLKTAAIFVYPQKTVVLPLWPSVIYGLAMAAFFEKRSSCFLQMAVVRSLRCLGLWISMA